MIEVPFTATVSGGTPPYRYSWSIGPSVEREITSAYGSDAFAGRIWQPGGYKIGLEVEDATGALVKRSSRTFEIDGSALYPLHFEITGTPTDDVEVNETFSVTLEVSGGSVISGSKINPYIAYLDTVNPDGLVQEIREVWEINAESVVDGGALTVPLSFSEPGTYTIRFGVATGSATEENRREAYESARTEVATATVRVVGCDTDHRHLCASQVACDGVNGVFIDGVCATPHVCADERIPYSFNAEFCDWGSIYAGCSGNASGKGDYSQIGSGNHYVCNLNGYYELRGSTTLLIFSCSSDDQSTCIQYNEWKAGVDTYPDKTIVRYDAEDPNNSPYNYFRIKPN